MSRPLIRDHMSDLLYPSSCCACGRRSVLALCNSCFGTIAASCGSDLDTGGLRGRVAFVGLRAAGDYGGPLRDMVLGLKDSQRRLADPLAALMSVALGNDPSYIRPSAVCFVPSTRSKIAERGFNPARMLALRIAELLGRPLSDALELARQVEDQDRTPGASRWTNVEGAFSGRQGVRLTGDVLLVDDVLTTGATADASSRALLTLGASSVRVLVAARAVLRKSP